MPRFFLPSVERPSSSTSVRARRCPRFAGVVFLLFASCQGGLVQAAQVAYVIPQPYRGTSLAPPARTDVGDPGAFGRAGPLAAVLRWDVRLDDRTLARTLDRWAASAGYVVRWEVRQSVPIRAPDSYEGTFEGALETALDLVPLGEGDDALEACVYPSSPPLVRITRRGEQARECPE